MQSNAMMYWIALFALFDGGPTYVTRARKGRKRIVGVVDLV